jgi:hypothetical protein
MNQLGRVNLCFRYGLNRLPEHFSRADFDIKEGKKREQALETTS